jgi:Transposase DDE domain
MSSAIVKLVTEFILALIHLRDVNLTQIALTICGESQVSSGYRRLQRFFVKAEICSKCLAKLLVSLAKLEDKKWMLIIDRTNWKFGQLHINILVLSIERFGVGIPILWSMLDNKGGNSNSKQREDLINRFIKIFGTKTIGSLLADREFIGDPWLKFLEDKGINFYIRIRSDLTIGRSEDELVTANSKVKKLKNNESIVLKGQRYLGKNYQGPRVRIAALRNDKGELVIIATNDKPEQALEVYRQRWAIESLFGCLKTRGFNFENTHMTELAKIEKLLAILAIAFTLCHIVGIWCNETKPITLKTHKRKSMSLFRYGLDYLRQILLNPLDLVLRIQEIIYLFTPQALYNQKSLIIC